MIIEYINYIRTVKAYSPMTCKSYERDLRHFAWWARKNMTDARWSQITKQTIDLYTEDAVRNEQKPATTNRRLSALSSFYNWMRYQGYKVENPCKYVSKRKIAKTIPNTIDTNQLRTAYERSEGVVHVMIGLLMFSGMRIGELLSLEWHDIDTENNTIRLHGKGAKERLVRVPEQALKEIRAAKEHCSTNGRMFNYGDRYARKMIHEELAKHCEAKQLSPHAIRHTFATHLAAQGENVNTISTLLGHEHLETTQKYINLAAAQNNMAAVTHAI